MAMQTRTMSNAEIVNAIKFTEEENFKKKKFPIKMSYDLRRSVANLQQAYKPYEESLNEICKNYGCTPSNMVVNFQNDPSKSIEENEEDRKQKQKEFNKDITDLLSEETDIEVNTINEDLLEKCEDDDRYDALTYEDIDGLWWIIDNDEIDESSLQIVDDPE